MAKEILQAIVFGQLGIVVFFALEGLSQLIRTVDQVKAGLNRELSIHGIVLTMYDVRNNLANQVDASISHATCP